MNETIARTPKKRMSKRKKKEIIFIVVMLFYPLLQFGLTWAFVNINSIILAFQHISFEGEITFAGFDNFIQIFTDPGFTTTMWGTEISNIWLILINSLLYAFVAIFISLPLALISSYFLSKKMPLSNVFRFIFFLPNIISVVALIYAFRMQLDSTAGLIYNVLDAIGIKINDTQWPSTTGIVLCYCVWAGLGYNVLLLSGAIGRVPKELFESAQMDGASSFKEFTKIMVPMIWPTVVTLIVLGMTSILTLYLQPVLFAYNNTETIAGTIFDGVSLGSTQYPYFSALGLFFSFIFAPLILLARKGISKRYSDVDC